MTHYEDDEHVIRLRVSGYVLLYALGALLVGLVCCSIWSTYYFTKNVMFWLFWLLIIVALGVFFWLTIVYYY